MKATEIKIRVKDVYLTDLYDGILTFETETGNIYDAYFWGAVFTVEEEKIVELSQFGEELDWNSIFTQNIAKEKRLKKTANKCEYIGYGQIESINPIIVNFGDINLDIGNWTSDERIIGEFIFWKIPRLDIATGLLQK
jgi:hypothetical protein